MCRKPRNKWSVNHQTVFLKVVLTNQPEGPAGGCSLWSEKKNTSFSKHQKSLFSFQVLLIKKRMQMCVYLHFQLRLVQKPSIIPNIGNRRLFQDVWNSFTFHCCLPRFPCYWDFRYYRWRPRRYPAIFVLWSPATTRRRAPLWGWLPRICSRVFPVGSTRLVPPKEPKYLQNGPKWSTYPPLSSAWKWETILRCTKRRWQKRPRSQTCQSRRKSVSDWGQSWNRPECKKGRRGPELQSRKACVL